MGLTKYRMIDQLVKMGGEGNDEPRSLEECPNCLGPYPAPTTGAESVVCGRCQFKNHLLSPIDNEWTVANTQPINTRSAAARTLRDVHAAYQRALNEIHSEVNALGGRGRQDNHFDEGYNYAIGEALKVIEKYGGADV